MVFLANIGAKLPAFNERYFAFAQAFNDHLALATLLYAAFPVALLLFLRSRAFARLLDGVRTLREISVKADYASLWTGFALLYDAAIPPMEAARTMKEAAEREDSRLAFARLEKLLYTGIYLESAVERAGFPLFIADGVRAATTGGNIVEGLRDMTNDLSEDVFNLTQRLRENLTLVSLLILAAAVVLFFFLSYYPMISVAMKNV
jgi:type II secretory pathway component PulF